MFSGVCGANCVFAVHAVRKCDVHRADIFVICDLVVIFVTIDVLDGNVVFAGHFFRLVTMAADQSCYVRVPRHFAGRHEVIHRNATEADDAVAEFAPGTRLILGSGGWGECRQSGKGADGCLSKFPACQSHTVFLLCGHRQQHLRDNKRTHLLARDYIHLQLRSAFEAYIYSAPLAEVWLDDGRLCVSEISAVVDRYKGVAAGRNIV